ncbi:MAG: hypothetical protein J3R72DRAFT_9568 [Linnemannia gamsii]|nr:MAG: hypothetical protein J3R72DRAFT_9568 [Linnemannia gamsii]
MAANVSTPPQSSSSNNSNEGGGRSNKTRFQPSRTPYQPLIHQHLSFPSSTSSFSIRHSTSTSSLLGPNDTTRITFLQNSFNGASSANSHASSNFLQPHGLPSSYDRRSFQGIGHGGNGAASGYGDSPLSFGAGTRSLYVTSAVVAAGLQGGTGGSGNNNNSNSSRPRASTTHEALLHDGTSDFNSLYTIDNTTPSQDLDDLSEDDDGVSYFGTAGQDFLLKKKRAQRSRVLYWIDLAALVVFLVLAGLTSPSGSDGGGWTWTWERIPWPLTVMAVLRILLMAFTARYSHGNYNTTVIFACVVCC